MSHSLRTWQIQRARISDIDAILRVFRDSVVSTCSEDYDPPQIDAWLKAAEDTARWAAKIERQYFLAVLVGNDLMGFGSLQNDTVDLLYVEATAQKLGVGKALVSALEEEARKKKVAILRAEVSLTARGFFEKHGFLMDELQVKRIGDVEIRNIAMHKPLLK
jgi:putative acetyltransferase